MRIAQLVSGKNVDGASRHALQLTQLLASHGVEVVLLCREDAWVYRQASQLANVRLLPISFRRRRANWRAVGRLLDQQGVQLTHAHKTSACLFSALLRWKLRLPSVATAHHQSWQIHWYGHNHIVAPSRSTADYLTRRCLVSPQKISVVPYPQDLTGGLWSAAPNPARLRKELGLSADAFVVTVVGTVDRRKNLLTLLRSLSHLGTLGQAIELVAVGTLDPSYALRLQATADRLGLANQLHLLGPRDDVADILAATDVVCLPSLQEQLPLAILEAMSATRPVIASAVGGIPDLIRDGIDGLLAPPKDEHRWAQQLHRLLVDPKLRSRLAGAGQQRVVEYCDPELRTRQIVDVYRRLLSSDSLDVA